MGARAKLEKIIALNAQCKIVTTCLAFLKLAE
jgi:hypothetical protein